MTSGWIDVDPGVPAILISKYQAIRIAGTEMKGWAGRVSVPIIGRILKTDSDRNCSDFCGQDFCDNMTVFRGTITETVTVPPKTAPLSHES